MRAVVHRNNGHRESPCAKALQKKRGYYRHRVARLCGTFSHVRFDNRHKRTVGAAKLVALLGDREREHLERRRAEDRLQLRGGLFVREVRLEPLGDASEDLARRRAVGIEKDIQGQVVVRIVDLVDHLVVEGVARDYAGLREPFVQQPLRKRADEAAKDVARAKVNPLWAFCRRLAHGGDVKLGKRDASGSPSILFVQYRINIQLHFISPLFVANARVVHPTISSMDFYGRKRQPFFRCTNYTKTRDAEQCRLALEVPKDCYNCHLFHCLNTAHVTWQGSPPSRHRI